MAVEHEKVWIIKIPIGEVLESLYISEEGEHVLFRFHLCFSSALCRRGLRKYTFEQNGIYCPD